MSKFMDSVRRAEAERYSLREQGGRGARLAGYVQSLRQELREELRWVGAVMIRSAGTQPPAPGPQHGAAAEARATAPSWEQAMALVAQQLAHAAQAAAALEAARLALSQQRDAAQACQALSQDLAAAAQEFEANAATVTRLAQDAPPSADPAAHCRQVADALQQAVAQCTSRLSRAMAVRR